MWKIDPGPQEDAKPTGTQSFLDWTGGRSWWSLARDIKTLAILEPPTWGSSNVYAQVWQNVPHFIRPSLLHLSTARVSGAVHWHVWEKPMSNIHICFPFDEESNDVEMADLGRHVKRGLLVLCPDDLPSHSIFDRATGHLSIYDWFSKATLALYKPQCIRTKGWDWANLAGVTAALSCGIADSGYTGGSSGPPAAAGKKKPFISLLGWHQLPRKIQTSRTPNFNGSGKGAAMRSDITVQEVRTHTIPELVQNEVKIKSAHIENMWHEWRQNALRD
ncbi:hypothetical protein FB451DRAFT_1500706 [Mycena latifolia]|nr:hypothetical protein FB451DRAFT_1500706 [Mycena latifolia]